MGVDLQGSCQLTVAQDLHRLTAAPDEPKPVKELRGDHTAWLEPSPLDELLETPNIDFLVEDAQWIAEAPFGQPAMQGHLAPFETRGLCEPRTRAVPFVPSRRRPTMS